MKKRYNYPLMLKALEYFVLNPYSEIHLREYARETGISINSAQRFLDYFLKERLLIETRRANLRFFKANLDSVLFRHIKVCFSLKKIEASGIIENMRDNNASSFLLFGSAAKGLDDRESDFDFVYIGPNKNLKVSDFEKILGAKIEVHFFSWVEWKKQAVVNKAFYQDVIKDGINLIGDKPFLV